LTHRALTELGDNGESDVSIDNPVSSKHNIDMYPYHRLGIIPEQKCVRTDVLDLLRQLAKALASSSESHLFEFG
jgi:hypothetical protein